MSSTLEQRKRELSVLKTQVEIDLARLKSRERYLKDQLAALRAELKEYGIPTR